MKRSVRRLVAATSCLGALALVPSCVAGGAGDEEAVLGTAHTALTTVFSATDDTMVNSFAPGTNYSTRNFVTAGDWTSDGTDYQNRSYLKFDLSAIPAGVIINSATLELNADTTDVAYGQGTANNLPPGHSTLSGSNAFLVRRVTSPWTGSSTTWQNAPSVTTVNEVTAPASTSPSQNYSIDVASLVQDMVNAPQASFGFELRLETEAHYREVTFASSEYPNVALRPRLVIDYAAAAQPVPGFADLHAHMMAEEAHGARWLYGSYEGQLTSCDGGGIQSDHARARQDLSGLKDEVDACGHDVLGLGALDPTLDLLVRGVGGIVLSEALTKAVGTAGDGGVHMGRRDFPDEWPAWDTIAHQQIHGDWLKAAHDGGLNLFVMSAVSSEFMCKLLPPQNGLPGCDEMADAERQLQMAHDFDAANSWVEIALTPDDARRIIGQGKLAMVLSVEVSELFDGPSWQTQFDHFYDLGVRTLQPVHQVDNRFAGAALHNSVFQVADYVKSCHLDNDCSELTLGFDVQNVGGICENVVGLKADGVALVQRMMSKGMPIDGAHMSLQGLRDLFAVTEANDYYPVYISHGHPQEIMGDDVAETEKATPAWVMKQLRQAGGMFGLRTFHNDTRTYEYSKVENNCAGSSRSLAQAVDFLHTGIKIHTAFGSDLNGMIQQTRPRFGDDACSATEIDIGEKDINLRGNFEAEAHCEQAEQRRNAPAGVGSDFDTKGLAHIGLLPDLLQDLKNLQADTSDIEGSAENFIRMWERASAQRSGPADPALDVDTSGIANYTPIGHRFDDYPKKCRRPYCEGYQELGGDCRFDAECVSGQCANVGASCGLDKGKCVCNDKPDCPLGQYCNKGLPGAGDNQCEPLKPDHTSCTRDDQCLSDACGGCAGLTGWCYAPSSRAVGQSCVADDECSSDRCSADCYANPTGKCLCKDDSDCNPSTQYCGWGFNSGVCQDKKSRGALCTKGRECSSGKCKWGFCAK